MHTYFKTRITICSKLEAKLFSKPSFCPYIDFLFTMQYNSVISLSLLLYEEISSDILQTFSGYIVRKNGPLVSTREYGEKTCCPRPISLPFSLHIKSKQGSQIRNSSYRGLAFYILIWPTFIQHPCCFSTFISSVT